MGGNDFDILVSFKTKPSASSFARTVVMSSTGTTALSRGPEIELDSNWLLQSVGTIGIPPKASIGDYTDFADVLFGIEFKYPSETSFDIDFVQLSPVDGSRYAYMMTSTWPHQNIVVDDGRNNIIYEANEDDTSKFFASTWRGVPIHLWPREEQRIYFLYEGGTGMDRFAKMKMRVKYRPRRLTI
jgi:hypothetical protein